MSIKENRKHHLEQMGLIEEEIDKLVFLIPKTTQNKDLEKNAIKTSLNAKLDNGSKECSLRDLNQIQGDCCLISVAKFIF